MKGGKELMQVIPLISTEEKITMRIGRVFFALGVLFIAVPLIAPAYAGRTVRLSLNSAGEVGNYSSGPQTQSADGRFVAFLSVADNLVTGDTNGKRDIFVRDRFTRSIRRVNISSTGEQANDDSYRPVISANGRYVAFESAASNLVPGDTPYTWDVFVHDLVSGTTERVSINSDGVPGDQKSGYPSLSADGRYVAFQSYAYNLGSGEDKETGIPDRDIFLHDRQTRKTVLISKTPQGTAGNYDSYEPSLSADGRFVAFSSWADDLVPNDANAVIDCFVYDRISGTTRIVSVDSNGKQGTGWSFGPVISADGRSVAFQSSSDLSPDDTGRYDIFIRDLNAGQTIKASVSSRGQGGNGASRYPAVSADGRFVAFDSDADNLVPGDDNRLSDIFVYDRKKAATVRVNLSTLGKQSVGADEYSGHSEAPSLSADGRFVAFSSTAVNLVANDTNGFSDVFMRERWYETGSDDVAIDLPAPQPACRAGQSCTLRYALHNHGATPATVRLVQVWPIGLNVESVAAGQGGTCTARNRKVQLCGWVGLAAGESAQVEFSVRIARAGSYDVVSSVYGLRREAKPRDNRLLLPLRVGE